MRAPGRWRGLVALVVASSLALAGEAALPEALEGVALGEPFAGLNPRLGLSGVVPGSPAEGERIYVLEPSYPLPDPARAYLESRPLDRLEIRFRAERVVRIRADYSDRRELTFDEMGEQLRDLHGDPAEVEDTGPMQVGRAKGLRLYLWLRIWTWRGDGRVLRVEGRHYGDQRSQETSERHEYRTILELESPAAAGVVP